MSDRICNVQKSRRSEAWCTAVLFGSALLLSVYAPDSGKNFEEYEKFMDEGFCLKVVAREQDAALLHGDLNVELLDCGARTMTRR